MSNWFIFCNYFRYFQIFLRYLERSKGIDLAALPNEILTDKIIETINLLHRCKIPFGSGLQMIVRNRTIVSITEK